MSKTKPIVAKDSRQLAEVLGLSVADAVEWDFRSILNEKIISLIAEQKITHSELAKRAGTSRTRITALLNRRRNDISTDLMLRVIACLGYLPKVSFKKVSGF